MSNDASTADMASFKPFNLSAEIARETEVYKRIFMNRKTCEGANMKMDFTDLTQQQQDEERQIFELLESLQKVDRAGLHEEALLLAWGCGLANDFRKYKETA